MKPKFPKHPKGWKKDTISPQVEWGSETPIKLTPSSSSLILKGEHMGEMTEKDK